MLKLGRAEQVAILAAVGKFPDETLGRWMTAWVKAQVEAGTSVGIDITGIPIPAKAGEFIRKSPQEIVAVLKSIGAEDYPKHQRRAMHKYINANILRIEETSRYPDRDECWLGDHKFSDEEYEDLLWTVVIKYGDEEKNKWGCSGCAQAILKVHPKLQNAT